MILLLFMLLVGFLEGADYIDFKRGYSFQYPDEWRLSKSVQGLDVVIINPMNSANISVVSQDLPKTMNLESFYRMNLEDLGKNQKLHIINRGERSVSGGKAYWVRYLKGKIEILHYFSIVNNVGYLITYGASTQIFENDLKICEQILNSFKIPKLSPDVVER